MAPHPPPWTAEELARATDAVVVGDPARPFSDVAEPATAESEHLTVLWDPRHRDAVASTRAGVIVAAPGSEALRSDVTWVLHPDPIAVLWVLAEWLGLTPVRQGIHPTAQVDPSAEVHPTAWVGPFCYVGPGVRIYAGAQLMGHCVLYGDAEVGPESVLHAGVVVYPRVRIGRRVLVHGGAVLGGDGFRFIPHPERPVKVPQLGRVVIEDDVEIGANTCIDRAFLGETRVGAGTKIDNLVQVAHNVTIGRACLIAAQVGIAGSSRIGHRVWMGGQAGVPDHVTVGDDVRLAAQTGITGDVPPGKVMAGSPAVERVLWLRIHAFLRELPRWLEKFRRWDRLWGEGEGRGGGVS